MKLKSKIIGLKPVFFNVTEIENYKLNNGFEFRPLNIEIKLKIFNVTDIEN